jgi:hypothetical protein
MDSHPFSGDIPMPCAGRLFFMSALVSGETLGSLGFPGACGNLSGLPLAQATSSVKKLEKKLKKTEKKTKKVLKKAERKAGRVGKPVLVGALKVGAVLVAAAAAGALGGEIELSGGEGEAEADSPPHPNCSMKIEGTLPIGRNAPKRLPQPPHPTVHARHRTPLPK